jgi:hypothetical protein
VESILDYEFVMVSKSGMSFLPHHKEHLKLLVTNKTIVDLLKNDDMMVHANDLIKQTDDDEIKFVLSEIINFIMF